MRSETSTLGVKKIKNKHGITILELVIVITLLAIMSTIVFISLGSYNKYARNTERVNNISNIKSAIELSFTENGYYPVPDSGTGITYSGSIVWTQGKFGKDAKRAAKAISEIPTDPLTKNEYTYSVTNSKTEYEIGGAIEGSLAQIPPTLNPSPQGRGKLEKSLVATPFSLGWKGWDRGTLGVFADSSDLKSYISGNYNGIFSKVSISGTDYVLALPSIISSDISDASLENIITNKKLSYKGYANLPHSYASNISSNEELVKISNFVSHTGSFDELRTIEAKRILFIYNLQQAYSGSTAINDSMIKTIVDTEVNTSSPSDEAKNLATNLVNAYFITKEEDKIPLIAISTSGSGCLLFDDTSGASFESGSTPCVLQ